MPQKPPKPNEVVAKRGKSWVWILIIVTLLIIFSGLGAATFRVLGPLLLFPVIIFLLFGMHYVLWGWWLPKYLKERGVSAEDD